VPTYDGEFSRGYFSGSSQRLAAVRPGVSRLYVDDHKSTSSGVLAVNDGVPRLEVRVDVGAAVDHHEFLGVDGAEVPAHLLRGIGRTRKRHRRPGNRRDTGTSCLCDDDRRYYNIHVANQLKMHHLKMTDEENWRSEKFSSPLHDVLGDRMISFAAARYSALSVEKKIPSR